jgi:hypothetical protein
VCVVFWKNSEVYKREVDTIDESLARIPNAAVRIKEGEDQIRRKTRDLRTRVAKCIEVEGGGFGTFIVNCNKSVACV